MYVSDIHRECVELMEEFGELMPLVEAPPELSVLRASVIDTLEIAMVWAELRAQDEFIDFLQDALSRVRFADERTGVIKELKRTESELRALIKEMVRLARESKFEPIKFEDPQMAIDFIVEAQEHQQNIDVMLLELEADPRNGGAFEAVYRSLHTIKGMAGFLNLVQCKDLARAAETVLDNHRKQGALLSPSAIDALLDASGVLQGYIQRLQEAVEKNEEIVFEAEVPGLVQRMYAIQVEAQTDAEEVEPARKESGEKRRSRVKVEPTVRIHAARLDELGDLVGELTVLDSMIQATAARLRNDKLRGQLLEIKRVVVRLHDLAGQLRAIPVQGLFEKMRRLARDVARKTEKEINFVLEGGVTEVDKSIVDALSDPMIHLIRNAVDHGLESAEDRVDSGKEATGTIKLNAYQRAGHLVIEVRDDGRGLDTEKIIRKAIEKGLIEPDHSLTKEAANRLIFKSGFSTQANVSDISGRGVGMDVVAKTVEKFSGRIEVDSELGRGTCVSLYFPLTLSVLDGLLVKIRGQRYVVPIRHVMRSIRPEPDCITNVMNQGEVLRSEHEFFPVARVGERLRIEGSKVELEDAFFVLVEAQERKGALVVEEILGQSRVVVRSLGEGIGKVPGIGGAAVMPDGKVGLIFDVGEILSLYSTEQPLAQAS